ncbi:bZIP transcription factor [Aspergillus tanneri]|uniref:BZIP domain-containing protein n=1 Tax=Aspergillus tanneri TaxID=1220188 RepID=A0A5M9MQI3_9EURO|nr:uncharacterized protein ATNIH1004_005273 [Aspergillus tanneri]KAA8649372.1 hypothetical protein ATNIH1004_005273 [Aspergillus tanneri]
MNTKDTYSCNIITKADNLAPSTRVRDNQRRSRARRKEYVRDLEQRLRKFESLGVEATREVQAAGRKVAAENALLRSLLRRRGVTEKEIQEYLESLTTNPDSLSCSSATAPAFVTSHLPLTQNVNREANDALRETGVGRRLSPSPLNPVANRHVNFPNTQASSADQPVAVDPVTPNTLDVQQPRAHSTPCEAAARIITTMRGHLDVQDVRSELGCQSESNCMRKPSDWWLPNLIQTEVLDDQPRWHMVELQDTLDLPQNPEAINHYARFLVLVYAFDRWAHDMSQAAEPNREKEQVINSLKNVPLDSIGKDTVADLHCVFQRTMSPERQACITYIQPIFLEWVVDRTGPWWRPRQQLKNQQGAPQMSRKAGSRKSFARRRYDVYEASGEIQIRTIYKDDANDAKARWLWWKNYPRKKLCGKEETDHYESEI